MQELAPDVIERNYRKEPLTRAEVTAILAKLPVEEVCNVRHATAKANGWKEKLPGKKAFTDAVLEESNLLRRPVILHGKKAYCGRDLDAIRALLS